MSDWNKNTTHPNLVIACESREIELHGKETRGDMIDLLEEHDDDLNGDGDGDGDGDDPEEATPATSAVPPKKPVVDHTVAAPTGETRDRTSTRPPRRPIDGNLPVSERTVAAPKPHQRPVAPSEFRIGGRVVIKDYGKRHGEIIGIDGDDLTIKLDGAVLDPGNSKRMVDKMTAHKSRCKTCAPEAA